MLPSAVYNWNCSILAWKISLGFYLNQKTHEALDVIVAEF